MNLPSVDASSRWGGGAAAGGAAAARRVKRRPVCWNVRHPVIRLLQLRGSWGRQSLLLIDVILPTQQAESSVRQMHVWMMLLYVYVCGSIWRHRLRTRSSSSSSLHRRL